MMTFRDLWNLVSSGESNNFGVFVGGMSTFFAFLYGVFSFRSWKKQREAEKRSDIAEEALNRFEMLKEKLGRWVKYSSFVFSRHSSGNVEKCNKLDIGKQKEFLDGINIHPYEVNNYGKKGDAIVNELQRIKNKVARLSDQYLIDELNRLEKTVKNLVWSLAAKHFSETDINLINIANTTFQEAEKEVEPLYKNIHKKLSDILMFKSQPIYVKIYSFLVNFWFNLK